MHRHKITDICTYIVKLDIVTDNYKQNTWTHWTLYEQYSIPLKDNNLI